MESHRFKTEEWQRFTLEHMKSDEIYEVSTKGKVRHYNQENKEWELIKTINQFKDKSGFEYVNNLKREKGSSKRLTESVHRLVAKAFLPQPSEDHKYVIHVDYNKQNNYADNLRWVTHKELKAHNNKNPKVLKARENRKGSITHSKLTETQVIRLKKKIARGKNPLYKIAKEFGITHTQLNRIRKGENWGHVKID